MEFIESNTKVSHRQAILANKYDRRDWVYHIKRTYNLTPEEYHTMYEKQGGLCQVCLNPQTNKKLSIDHCHQTGKVRGLLCTSCNLALGKLKDDPEIIKSLLLYVRHHKLS